MMGVEDMRFKESSDRSWNALILFFYCLCKSICSCDGPYICVEPLFLSIKKSGHKSHEIVRNKTPS